MSETRKDPRTPLSLKVRFKSATVDEFIEQYSGDISRGGIFIKTKSPMAIGTLLKFEFQLKDESRIIHGVGRVVWTRDKGAEGDAERPPGMGIKFIKMDPDSQKLVDAIVADRGESVGEFESKASELSKTGGVRESSPDVREQVKDAGQSLAAALKDADPGLVSEVERAARGDEPTGKQSLAAVEEAVRASEPTPMKVPLEPRGGGGGDGKAGAKDFPAPETPVVAVQETKREGGVPWIAVVLGVAALGAVAFFALRGGGAPSDAPAAAPEAEPVVAAPAPSPAPATELPAPAPDAAAALGDAGPQAAEPTEGGPAPELSPETSTELTVLANVPAVGLRVSVGGAPVAALPVRVPRSSEVELRVSAPGYAELVQTVKTAALPKQLVRVKLVPLPHVVIVETVPPGARVTAGMGGAISPKEIVLVGMPPPKLVITAGLPGYARVTEKVSASDFALEGGRMVLRKTITLTELPKAAPRPAAAPAAAPAAVPAAKKPASADESGMPPAVNLNEAAKDAAPAPAPAPALAPTTPAPAPAEPAPATP